MNGRVIAFRTDASFDIGTGHVMRCLALADALRNKGAVCHFVCRSQPGDMIQLVQRKGYEVRALPEPDVTSSGEGDFSGPAHAAWLRTDQGTDALETREVLEELNVDWLVVDHYALDARWEAKQRGVASRLMVIDDLADRRHDCDLLLDHNLGRRASSYTDLVPPECKLLTGERYALLRPEFAELRDASLLRRDSRRLRSLLVSMGGIDKNNDTSAVLTALIGCGIPSDCKIVVVLGSGCPWQAQVQQLAATLQWEVRVLNDTHDMAKLMSRSDLAIGAGGVTGLERVCLGLPSVMLETADNQKNALAEFEKRGLAITAPGFQHLARSEKISTVERLVRKAVSNDSIAGPIDSGCDGLGSRRVIETLASMDADAISSSRPGASLMPDRSGTDAG